MSSKRTAALAALGAFDWSRPKSGDLRQFDPLEVGRLETDMWRSYYDRKPLALFAALAELLRRQYHLSITQSLAASYDAARAAFVFKDGNSRAGYEKALPNLVRYYRAILPAAADAGRAGKLELEWWIIHRERSRYGRVELENGLAALQAAIYALPAGPFATHARLRAQAMLLRDQKAEAGGVSEEDWRRIRALLDESWDSLHRAVNHSPHGSS